MGERNTARSEDGQVETTIGRQFLRLGGGHSAIYAPTEFSLTFAGRTHRVFAWDRLKYTNTHHNWEDESIAATRSLRVRWRQVNLESQSVRADRLSDDVEILRETPLEPSP